MYLSLFVPTLLFSFVSLDQVKSHIAHHGVSISHHGSGHGSQQGSVLGSQQRSAHDTFQSWLSSINKSIQGKVVDYVRKTIGLFPHWSSHESLDSLGSISQNYSIRAVSLRIIHVNGIHHHIHGNLNKAKYNQRPKIQKISKTKIEWQSHLLGFALKSPPVQTHPQSSGSPFIEKYVSFANWDDDSGSEHDIFNNLEGLFDADTLTVLSDVNDEDYKLLRAFLKDEMLKKMQHDLQRQPDKVIVYVDTTRRYAFVFGKTHKGVMIVRMLDNDQKNILTALKELRKRVKSQDDMADLPGVKASSILP